MAKRLTLWAATALTLTAGAAFAEGETLDTVVATVAGSEITMRDVLAVRRQLPEQYASLPDAQLFPGIVEQLTQQRALAASITEEPSWLSALMSLQRDGILAGHAIEQISANVVITDADIQAAYDAQFADFNGAPEFNASHILVETEEKAAELIGQLADGADFAELAKEHSTGPSGPRGGELGWFGEGMMVPEFETAVKTLEVGGVSAPVQTQFGWHVVKLNDARTTEAPTLDELRADIAGQLQSQALAEQQQALIEAAEITIVDGIDPAALSALSFE